MNKELGDRVLKALSIILAVLLFAAGPLPSQGEAAPAARPAP
jgi:hypothetical protein